MTAPTSSARPFQRISLKYSMVEEPDLSILDIFRLLADLGYDGVELDAPNDLPMAEILAAQKASGLAIPGVINSAHWKTPLTDPDPAVRQACVEATKTALSMARDYGAETMLLVPGVVRGETSYKQAYDRAVEGIEKILPHAEATGVCVALENVWNNFLLSPLEAARLVDSFEHPKLGWYFDVGNILRYGRPADWIEVLGKRILRVDLKEYSLKKMDNEGPWKGFDVELGDGDCDWPTVNAALRAAGYSGWASLEVPGGDRKRLAEIRARAERIAGA